MKQSIKVSMVLIGLVLFVYAVALYDYYPIQFAIVKPLVTVYSLFPVNSSKCVKENNQIYVYSETSITAKSAFFNIYNSTTPQLQACPQYVMTSKTVSDRSVFEGKMTLDGSSGSVSWVVPPGSYSYGIVYYDSLHIPLFSTSGPFEIISNLTALTYKVTMSCDNAKGVVLPAPGTYKFARQEKIYIKAVPTGAEDFTRWSINDIAQMTTNPANVTVSSDMDIIPVFSGDIPPTPQIPVERTLIGSVGLIILALGVLIKQDSK